MCLSVCLYVCSLLRYRLTPTSQTAPISRSRMAYIYRIRILRGKKWKEVVSHLNIFVWKWSKIAADFALQNMVETTLPDGLETSG